MAFDSGSSGNESISQINVTPLVDVMLVLLIIFMVTAPILQQGVSIDLPKVTAGPLTGQEEQLVVNIGKAGQLFLNDTPMSYSYHQLDRLLLDAYAESGSGIGHTYVGAFPSFRIDHIMHSRRLTASASCTELLSDVSPFTGSVIQKSQIANWG